MSKQINPSTRVGILGGGQLARLLALSAHSLGLKPVVFSESLEDPAQQVTLYHHIGSLKDPKHLAQFLKSVDVATFESEFLSGPLLLEAQQQSKTPIFPSVATMELLQDRLTQKQNLDIHQLATAPWLAVQTADEAMNAAKELSFPLVFKQRRFGYDGYGTFVIKNSKQLTTFCKKNFPNSYGFIAEQWIAFQRELACVFARNLSGEISHYPLVQSLQKDARCFWVKGPIRHSQFSKFVQKFSHFLRQTKYVGVIGVEFFETRQGLLVNELAPRVHNSAHYTLTAFSVSQFELHWRALLDQSLHLPSPNAKGFAMVNLLGGSKKPKWSLCSDSQWHWYGKAESRPGRKMGHLNALGATPDEALSKALKSLKRIQS